MNITERQIQAIEALAKYKFLTSNQLAYIFRNKTTKSASTILKALTDGNKPLLHYKDFGVLAGHGKLPRVFFLTKYGKDFLIEHLDYEEKNIKFIKNKSALFLRDYFHRCDTVNFNIYLHEWIKESGYQLDFFNYYFDKSGSNRNGTGKIFNSLEKGDFKIIPDGLGVFQTPSRPYIFLFEQHNGKDKKRAVNQILNHCLAISEGIASEKYNINRSSRVYYVFDDSTCMIKTMEELRAIKDFEPFKGHFYFKTSDGLKKSFFNNWVDICHKQKGFI